MSHDEPVRTPEDEHGGRKTTAPATRPWRDLQPVCPACENPVPGGARACPFCRQFLPDPYAGRLANPKRRVVAEVLDSIFQDGGLLGSIWPALLPSGAGTALVSVLSAIYWASSLYLWTKGTTPAKRVLGMKVVTEDGEPAGFFRMAFRETIGKFGSAVVFGLGYLAVLTDEENRGWHDRWAGTWVVLEDDD